MTILTRNARIERRKTKAAALCAMEDHLYRTVWGKYHARPSQIKAGARKLLDVLMAISRRAARTAQAVQV